MTATNRLEGGCSCGELRYRLLSRPLFVHGCHCRRFQLGSGSAFAVIAMIERDGMQLTKGRAALFEGPLERRPGRAQCARCGSALWVRDATSTLLLVRAGTLDQPRLLAPAIHLNTDYQQPWVMLPPDVPEVSCEYQLDEIWPVESLARLRGLWEPGPPSSMSIELWATGDQPRHIVHVANAGPATDRIDCDLHRPLSIDPALYGFEGLGFSDETQPPDVARPTLEVPIGLIERAQTLKWLQELHDRHRAQWQARLFCRPDDFTFDRQCLLERAKIVEAITAPGLPLHRLMPGYRLSNRQSDGSVWVGHGEQLIIDTVVFAEKVFDRQRRVVETRTDWRYRNRPSLVLHREYSLGRTEVIDFTSGVELDFGEHCGSGRQFRNMRLAAFFLELARLQRADHGQVSPDAAREHQLVSDLLAYCFAIDDESTSPIYPLTNPPVDGAELGPPNDSSTLH